MTTYTQSAYNQFETPSGAAGDGLNPPAEMAHLRDQIDQRLSFGGAEGIPNAGSGLTAIPSGRVFAGKRVFSLDTSIEYLYWGGAWGEYNAQPRNFTPNIPNITSIGNGTVAGSFGWANGRLYGRIVITVGSTTTFASGSALLVTLPQATKLNTNAVDTSYPHIGGGFLLDISASTRTPLMFILDNANRFAMWAGSTAVTGTAPVALATGDVISGSFDVKFY